MARRRQIEAFDRRSDRAVEAAEVQGPAGSIRLFEGIGVGVSDRAVVPADCKAHKRLAGPKLIVGQAQQLALAAR